MPTMRWLLTASVLVAAFLITHRLEWHFGRPWDAKVRRGERGRAWFVSDGLRKRLALEDRRDA